MESRLRQGISQEDVMRIGEDAVHAAGAILSVYRKFTDEDGLMVALTVILKLLHRKDGLEKEQALVAHAIASMVLDAMPEDMTLETLRERGAGDGN